ncbi:hypothetical protein F5Y15DRAFT_410494 [Xylariaceae sp. FL0016]|nr:hypothetical protein F5Y15DRAFT_410494 [Xylariaceae sp. FL0016]
MSSESYSASLDSLMAPEDNSDLVMVCEGQRFRLCKSIVCPQSSVLAACFRRGHKEATFNTVEVAYDAATCKLMLQFLNTGDYHLNPTRDTSTTDQDHMTELERLSSDNLFIDISVETLKLNDEPEENTHKPSDDLPMAVSCHVRVNAIADYYDIPALRRLSSTRFQRAFEDQWSAGTFVEVIDDACRTTGDPLLFEAAGFSTAEHLEELLSMSTYVALEPPREFSRGLQARCLEKIVAYERGLEDLKWKKGMTETALDLAKGKLRGFRQCMQSLRKTKYCANMRCPNAFSCYIKEKVVGNGETRYILRCSTCKCKH